MILNENENYDDYIDKLDVIDMKLNELKKIQMNHDNLIKRLNYNFRYDLLKVKSNNRIFLLNKNKKHELNFKLSPLIIVSSLLLLINSEYIISYLRYVYS